MSRETESKEKFFNASLINDKISWLKKRLLLNLGFVPKLFGYTDENLYYLTNSKLKEWVTGVEYYFGVTFKGTEGSPDDFPGFLINDKMIKVFHAPFASELYPYQNNIVKNFYKWARSRLLARADPNPWHRLSKAIQVTSECGVPKINIHVVDIIFAPYSDKLFYELNKMAGHKGVIICLENTPRTPSERAHDKEEWDIVHQPLKLIEYLEKNKLDNMRLTIDTAHIAASEYSMIEMWKDIVQRTNEDINKYISHFHLVDYDKKNNFDAAVPGDGIIGLPAFQTIIADLFSQRFEGTISLEVAPLYYRYNTYKVVWNVIKRLLSPLKPDVREEEEYILNIIKKLII